MGLDKVIKNRRSKRTYLEKSIRADKLGEILDTARYAPSAGNLQNWRFIVITDKSTKQKVAEACLKQYWINQAPILILICGDIEVAERIYRKKAESYTIQSCANAAILMQLKAEELKLSTCWVGSFDENAIQRELRIPPHLKPIILLTLGYSKETSIKKKMNTLSAITYFDKFGNKEKLLTQGAIKANIKKIKEFLTKNKKDK